MDPSCGPKKVKVSLIMGPAPWGPSSFVLCISNATLLPGKHTSLHFLIQSDLTYSLFLLVVTWILASDL